MKPTANSNQGKSAASSGTISCRGRTVGLLLTLLCTVLAPALAQSQESSPAPAATAKVPELAEAQPILPGQRRYDSLPAVEAQEISLMLQGKKPLAFAAAAAATPAAITETEFADMWIGNRPRFVTAAKRVTLRFEREDKGFDFRVDLENDAIVVRSSAARFPKQVGGLRAPVKGAKARQILLQSRNQGSMAIFIPQVSLSEANRGVLLCPRDFVGGESRKERISLRDSGYRVVSADFQVDGEVSTQLRGSLDTGRARAVIYTSPAVLPSDPYIDESYAREPRARNFYTAAVGKRGVIDRRMRHDGYASYLVGAIEAEAELHNSAGYRRVSSQLEAIYIQEVNLDEPRQIVLPTLEAVGTPIELELREHEIESGQRVGFPVTVAPGPCYIVLRKVGRPTHRYSKEELKTSAAR